MKKIISIALIFAMCITLAACGGNNSAEGGESLSDLGVDYDELISYIPNGPLQDHDLDEDKIKDALDMTCEYIFGQMDQDVFTDLKYKTEHSDQLGMISWYTSYHYSEVASCVFVDDEAAILAWDSLIDLQNSLSVFADAAVPTFMGDENLDYHCLIALANDSNAEKFILAAFDGEIIYDVTGRYSGAQNQTGTAEI